MSAAHLIVSDLDGTLLGADSWITDTTAEGIRRVVDQGAVFAVATGRSVATARERVEPVGAVRWLITANGAALYDLESGETVATRLVRAPRVPPIVESINSDLGGCGFSWETAEGVFYDEAYGRIRLAVDGRPSYTNGTLATFTPGRHDLFKIMVVHRDLQGRRLADRLREAVGPGVNLQSSGLTFMEITALDADKSLMAEHLRRVLGIDPDRTIAFGDQENDRRLLEWAQRGYLMADGDPTVAGSSALVAPSHLDDGVAQVLDLLFPST